MKTKLLALSAVVAAAWAISYGITNTNRQPSADWQKREALFAGLDTNLQKVADQIQAVQGESICDSDQQCHVLGLGTRVCGYYKNFLVYSTQDAKESQLLPLVTQFNRLHKKVADLSLAANSCGSPPAPVHCIERHCTPDVH